ncbi:MAG: PD-(D/E)XK nuclease family protein, partial [Thermodesulfobacteriota bacterium]|nr:PD-(D/E)XK nuclease family protein [Thermodesulfobacteriota bacterium]
MNIYTVPFCEDILDLATRAILKEPELTRLAVILPNQRSKVYFRYRLLETAGKEALFLPKIFEMSEFQREIVQMKGGMILDNLGRSLLLRQAIKDTKVNLSPLFKGNDAFFLGDFLDFLAIGKRLLRFFDELILEKVDFDTLKKESLYTDFEHHIEVLEAIYNSYNTNLEEKGFIDQNVEIAKGKLKTDVLYEVKSLYVIGSVTMTVSEAQLFSTLSNDLSINIFLHQGKELSSHQKLLVDQLGARIDCVGKIGDFSFNDPVVTIRAFSSTVAQVGFIKYAIEEALKEGVRPEKIGVILPDESLKNFLLMFLGEEKLNITMGRDLKDSLIFRFISDISNLVHAIRDDGNLYHKDLLRFIKNPLLKSMGLRNKSFREATVKISDMVKKHQLVFVDLERIKNEYIKDEGNVTDLVDFIRGIITDFKNPTSLQDFCDYLFRFMSSLPKYVIHKEIVDNLYFRGAWEKICDTIQKLPSLSLLDEQLHHARTDGAVTYLVLLMNLLSEETFPLPGQFQDKIQVMGVLETRNILFDVVIIPNMNEGYFPQKSDKDMFLNTEIKRRVGLPTIKDREALYKYHFDRLCYGAKKVYLSYVENPEVGLRSRFVEELIFKKAFGTGWCAQEKDIYTSDHFSHFLFPRKEKQYTRQLPLKKGTHIIKKLETMTFTPSIVRGYLQCPYHFYLAYIAEVKAPDFVEERIEPYHIGNLFHHVMENLYRMVDPPSLSHEDLYEMITCEFEKELYKQEILKFKPSEEIKIILFKKRLLQFVKNEKLHFSEGWVPDKKYFEKRLEAHISLGQRTLKLAGRPDRTDRHVREREKFILIDYKTGTLPSKRECTLGDSFTAIQLPFYLYLLNKSEGKDFKHCAGLYFYDLKERIRLVNCYDAFSHQKQDFMEGFETFLQNTFCELFDE